LRYEIDSQSFQVKMFDDNDASFLIQPHYPNGDVFDSVEEATKWAIAFTSETHFAPEGKSFAPKPKPTDAEIAERRAYLMSKDPTLTEDF
jgi:hypothetical protein